MPSVSGKQHRLMAAVATNPAVAKKTKIPQSVGKEFMEADKGKKFKGGGEMKESKAMVKKEIGFMKKKGAPKSMIKHEMKEAGMKKMAVGGMAARAASKAPAYAKPYINASKAPAYAKPYVGAKSAAAPSPGIAKMPMVPGTQRGSDMQKLKADMISKASQVASKPQMANAPMRNMGSAAAGMGRAVMGKKAGGLAAGHKQADGIAKKGKTRAMQVKMAGGGKTKKYC